MKFVKFFIGFLIICAFTMFATANLQKIQVNFLFDNQPLLGYQTTSVTDSSGKIVEQESPRQIPLFVLIFITFGAGFIVSGILTAGVLRKQKKLNKQLKKSCMVMNKELDELRNLPVQSTDKSSKNEDESSLETTLPVK